MASTDSVTAPIAIVNFDFRASGTVGKSIEIAASARSAGLPAELWVVSAKGPLQERVPPDVPVRVCGTAFGKPRALALALAIPALAVMIRRHRPAVLLSGGNHSHLPVRAAALLSGCRKRLRFGLRASNSSRRPDSGEPGVLALSKYRGADFIAAVTSALVPEIVASGTRAEVRTIANGIDLQRAATLATAPPEHPAPPPGDGPLLVAAGRLARQKGFDVLLQALALLPGLRLVIAGSGPEAGNLREAVARLGLGDRVALPGHLANPFAMIAGASVFVMPSLWEGASNALLEALACGVGIVASDCPVGNAEILDHGRFGTLAIPGDAAALATAIASELATHRSPAVQKARAARFAIEDCLGQWTALLAEEHRRGLALRQPHLAGAVRSSPAVISLLSGKKSAVRS